MPFSLARKAYKFGGAEWDKKALLFSMKYHATLLSHQPKIYLPLEKLQCDQ